MNRVNMGIIALIAAAVTGGVLGHGPVRAQATLSKGHLQMRSAGQSSYVDYGEITSVNTIHYPTQVGDTIAIYTANGTRCQVVPNTSYHVTDRLRRDFIQLRKEILDAASKPSGIIRCQWAGLGFGTVLLGEGEDGDIGSYFIHISEAP